MFDHSNVGHGLTQQEAFLRPSPIATSDFASNMNTPQTLSHRNQALGREGERGCGSGGGGGGGRGHFERQQIGQRIISALDGLCLRIRATCEDLPSEIHLEPAFPAQYISLSKVWYQGLTVFRDILNNRPPRDLVDIIDSLLVASSICAVIPNNEWMRRQ
jgi:hypothetical protein